MIRCEKYDNKIMNSYIGLDLGGTSIKGGRIRENGLESKEMAMVTQQGSPKEIFEEISQVIERLWTKDILGIGFAVPALIDFTSGVMHGLSNIVQLNGFPIRQKLEERFDVQVLLENDANCFVLGEKKYGVAKGYKNIVGLTTGTGVGGGVMLNGKLYVGPNCGAGEFGMISYKDSNFENYCSGNFFVNKYGKKGEELSRLIECGDKMAKAAFDDYGKHIGDLIKLICYVLDPEVIVIGGSVSRSFGHYQKTMKQSLENFYFDGSNKVSILPSSDNDIAIYGAVSLFDYED